MSRTLLLTAATPPLVDVVASMAPGEQTVLTTDGSTVAVVTCPTLKSWPSEPGTAKDRTFWMSPDFDAPLDDFAEYMP